MRKGKRRACKVPLLRYTLIDEMMADPLRPMPANKRLHHMGIILTSLESLAKGEKPTLQDLANVSDACNILDTLHGTEFKDRQTGEGGYRLDIEADVIREACKAAFDAFHRNRNTGSLRMTGPGLAVMREAIDTYAALIEQLPERVIIRAWRDHCKEAAETINSGRRDENTVILEA